MKFSEKVYDVLKYLDRIFLPAALTFYSVLAQQWNLPYTTQIITTGTAFITFLGAVLEISNAKYIATKSGGVPNDSE